MWVAFAFAKATHIFQQKTLANIFSKNISVYAIFNDQSFKDTLNNGIVSFEQLDPDTKTFQEQLNHIWKRTFGHERPAKIPISLRIRADWS